MLPSSSEILSVRLTCMSTAATVEMGASLPPPSYPSPGLGWGSPGIKALLAMVVGEWRLPAAGQGRVCAGTLGFLLDPGGGAVESYCRSGGGRARPESVTEGTGRASDTLCSLRWATSTLSGFQFTESHRHF